MKISQQNANTMKISGNSAPDKELLRLIQR